jgi:hypothetical protein
MGAVFEPGYIVVTEDGERMGSLAEDGLLPVSGDLLILRHPDDQGRPGKSCGGSTSTLSTSSSSSGR